MQRVTFNQRGEIRLGARVGDPFLDLKLAQPSLPSEILAFVNAGETAMALARKTIERADATFLLPEADVMLLAPIPRPGKIVSIGHNYHGHTGATPSAYPDVFVKFNNVLFTPHQPIVLPRISTQVDYEGELDIVVGKRARNLTENRALDFVAGYAIFNDVTARDSQKQQSQWTMGNRCA